MSLRGFETKMDVARVAIFDQPRRIIFATGAVEQYLATEARRLGGKNALVVTDKGVRKAGMADTVLDVEEGDSSQLVRRDHGRTNS